MTRLSALIGIALLSAGTLALVTLIGEAAPQSAGFGAISIDMDPSGNSATSLGARDECREALPGATLTLDVTIEDISPDTPLFGYEYTLSFPGPTITFTDREPMKVRDQPSSQLFDGSDPVPQFDGQMTVSIIDIGDVEDSYETGSGVLDRLTIEVATDAGPGVYVIGIDNAVLLDPQAEAHSPPITRNARLAVGVSCAGSTPLPEVTASATPVPSGATAAPDGTIAPTSSASTPASSATPDGGTATSASPGVSATPSPGPYAQPSPTDAEGEDGDGGGGSGLWIVLGVVAIVVALGLSAWLAYNRYARR